MIRTRSLALAALATFALTTAARSAPDVAPFPTPGGYKTVRTAQTTKDAREPAATDRATAGYLGVVIGAQGGKPVIDAVAPGSPADAAGLKEGDAVLRIDGTPVSTVPAAREALRGKLPDETVELTVSRGAKELTASAKLRAASAPLKEEERGGFGGFGGKGGGWNDRIGRAWRKPTYNLAIIGVEYPDVKHNDKIGDKDWEDSMFSLGSYTGKSATGQPVYGSMNDYYRELSYGKFKIEGKFVGWYEVSKKRTDYSSGSGVSAKEKTGLLTEALDLVTKKLGKDGLKEYDGVFFIYAGARVNTTRGGLYWPHRATVSYGGRGLPYFIVQEGGAQMNDISVFCHEFGHMPGPKRPAARASGSGVPCPTRSAAAGRSTSARGANCNSAGSPPLSSTRP